MKKSLTTLIVVLALGCTAHTRAAEPSIRSVDFQNFTYPPSCVEKSVTVKGGKLRNSTDDSLPTTYDVTRVLYGDLDGNGKDEAVVETLCNTGGSGMFSQAYVYAMTNGKPTVVAEIDGGDRGTGGIVDIKLVKNHLIVTQNESSVACCPEFIITTEYKLEGSKLVPVGKPVKTKVVEPD